jgi:outer membrane biosynthesis protein TonB
MSDPGSNWQSQTIDSSWRRLPLVTLVSLLTWSILLLAFGLYLAHMHPPAPSLDAIQASIIEVPGPAGGGGGTRGASHTGSPLPRRAQEPKRAATHALISAAAKPSHNIVRRPRFKPLAESAIMRPRESMQKNHALLTNRNVAKVASASGADESGAATAGKGSSGSVGEGAGNSSGAGSGNAVGPGSGTGRGCGFGSGSDGPRAIYAPVPTIPDDLRDEVLEATAVALFHVSREGKATVSLLSPTEFDELNDLILDTLGKWRFRPALKGGVAVDSAAEVRLRITVQ